MRKRTLFAFCAVALVAVIGVTAALAGSGGRATPTVKPKPAKATSQSSGGVVESSTPASDAAEYWTEERMRSAGPLEKTVPGGSTTVAPSPQAPKSAGPASTAKAPNVTNSAKPANTRTQTKPSRSQAADEGGTVSADTTDDAAAYWTDEQMADAGPKQPEVAGGNGSEGSAGSGGLVPGTP